MAVRTFLILIGVCCPGNIKVAVEFAQSRFPAANDSYGGKL